MASAGYGLRLVFRGISRQGLIVESVGADFAQAVANRIDMRLPGEGMFSPLLVALLTWQLKSRLGISAANVDRECHASD